MALSEADKMAISGMLRQEDEEEKKRKASQGAGGIGGFALDVLPFGRQAEKIFTGRGDEITPGEVAGEALLSAVPFGLGKVAKGIKGARGAAKAGKPSPQQILDDAGEAATTSRASTPATDVLTGKTTTPLSRISERLQGAQTGIKAGAKVGSRELSAKRAGELNTHLKSVANPSDSADTILRRNEEFMQNQGQAIQDTLATNNKALAASDTAGIVKSVKRPIGVDNETNAVYRDLAGRVKGTKDVQGLHQLRREIDDNINFARSGDSVDPVREQVLRSFRDSISGKVGDKVPAIKPLNKAYSNAAEASDYLGAKVRGAGGGVSGGVSAFGLPKVGGSAIQGAAGVLGRGADAVSGAAARVPAGVQRVAKPLAAQAGVRAGADILGGREYANMFDSAGDDQEVAAQETPPGAVPGAVAGDVAGDGVSTNVPSPAIMQREAANAMMAGDYETAEQILSLSEAFGADTEMSAGDEKAGAALNTLDQVEGLFKQAGGGQGLAGFGSRLAAGARMNPEVEAYDSVRRSAAVQLARAFGEVGVLSNQDIDMYAKMLPDSTSTQEAADIQFQTLRDRLAMANPTNTSGASQVLKAYGF